MEEARFVGLELGEVAHDGVGDEVGAARFRGQGEGFLEPGRGRLALGSAHWVGLGREVLGI